MLEVAAGARDRRATQIVRQLHRRIVRFARRSHQRDDITVVVCKVGPPR